MNSNELNEIQQILTGLSEKGSQAFFSKMVPGHQKIYGVKTPALNGIAKKYQYGSFTLAEQLWNSGALEEKIIAIKIIEKTGKEDPRRLLKLFRQFAKQIDNWAVCDGLGMQFLRGIVRTEDDAIFRIAKKINRSRDPWQRRLSLVMVEWYTRDKKKWPEINALVENLEQDTSYYVKKSLVWIKKKLEKGK